MATQLQHIVFETLGIVLGLILILFGILLLKTKYRFIAVSLILLGLAGAIVDTWFIFTFL